MKNKFFTISLLLFSLFYANSSFCQTKAEHIQQIVDSFLLAYKVPAIAVSVIQADQIFYAVSGVKKVGASMPIDRQSLFHLGSNTKAITATLAATLVENGELNWDDKLIDIVPALKGNIHQAYTNITLEQLLSHRAKIAPFEEEESKEWKNIPSAIARSKNQKLSFAKYALSLAPVSFGTKNHSYSNGGYILAGLMLEAKTGKSWEALIKTLFEEWQLDYYVGFPSQKSATASFGHQRKLLSFLSKNKYKFVPPNKEFPLDNYFAPAGNFSMNLTDFSTFIQCHLKGLMGQDNYLKASTYQHLHFGFKDYALGWYNGNIGETTKLFSYHAGSLGTSSSAVILSADRSIGIVILVNSDDKQTTILRNKLRERLWDLYGQQ